MSQTETQPGTTPSPRRTSPHGLGNRVGRLLWGIVWAVLFRPSPRPLHLWRNTLLRLFGARLHRTSRVFSSARVWAPWNLAMGPHATISEHVDVYNVEPITLGARAAVSQYSFLCAASHDHEDPALPLISAPITIGDDAWVAADVFVAPGVEIGTGTVVGARASVFKSLPPWVVATGSPARPVGPRRLPGRSPA
ncbi:MAG: putative colanic acid biosynthesis acetyltransferase [Phycisphaerae bacterium]|nr:putative colanic acid biosynthesis acetyltransferase [Phycisphaerae bacterium]